MKRLLAALAVLCLTLMAHGQGIPFIRNFTVEDYHANNTNFDIETDESGNVFVANFEGLLYYDFVEWRLVHTPGITRVTVVYRAKDNTIWVGGYNYFGKVVIKANGEIALRRVGKEDLFRGEVKEIYELDGELLFIADNAVVYQVKDDKVSVKKNVDKESLRMGMLDVVDIAALEKGEKDIAKQDTVQIEPLGNGLKAIVMKNAGIVIADDKNHPLYTITDANGLCSNNVSYTAYDGRGHLWGATNKGIFVVKIPSAFSHFTSFEGLASTILSIESVNGVIYVGTDDGLFRREGYHFARVPGVPHACWDLKKSGNGLLAATADGIFRIHPDGSVRHLTTTNTFVLMDEGALIYSGENDGVYLIGADGQGREKVCHMDNVRKIVKDKDGTIWVQSLYGAVWYKKADDSTFQVYKSGEKSETIQTIVMTGGKATIVNAESTTPFGYPLVSYVDDSGVTWLTNNEGKALYRWKDGKSLTDMDQLLFPVNHMPIKSIHICHDEIWLGSDKGLIAINTQSKDPDMGASSKLHIRSVMLGGDSVLWGGFGKMAEKQLDYNENDLTFTFSLDYPSVVGQTMYRYRLNNNDWSSWSTNTSASFSNLAYGTYTFTVQARDMFGRVIETSSFNFHISPPFYFKWYMILVYLLLMGGLVHLISQLRVQKVRQEKARLEALVQERTAEVVRLEKMATAGKLTQGLIDRILNPLNYIINFAKLSEGLVGDVQANVEDEKENMDEENYEDTMDVLGMLKGNLQKVGEHGQNTSRTLKAMEEMLKDRSGGLVPMDLMVVISQDKDMLLEYYKQEISSHGINVVFDDSKEEVAINGNAEQLSKTIMSILSNAVSAVVKKAKKMQAGNGMPGAYSPEIALHVTRQGNTILVSIRDNGIGIEKTILDKIFDPFFTTKSTSEAAGVGLYLSREIVQNHGGDIQVNSVKDEYSEFIITLPALH